MDQADDLAELLRRMRSGDLDASHRLYQRYGTFIRVAVRRRLHPKLRSRFDSLDFVQDVWASFVAIPEEQLCFDSPKALRAFLNKVAYNKVIDVLRQQFQSDKYDITRELPLDPIERDRRLPSRVATPSQWVIADEEFERLLNHFPEGHRVIIERLREGYSAQDIANMTNISMSTVGRVVKRLKDITGV